VTGRCRGGVGGEDPLLDDSLMLAARWRYAGVPVELAVVAGAMHGFTLFPLSITERESVRQHEFLAKA
jgi:acetyl esterase/lipase